MFKKRSEHFIDDSKDLFGFFGKMPFTAELLSYQSVGKEIHEFERRLSDIFKIIDKQKVQGIGPGIERMPVIHFLFIGKQQSDITIGVLFSSWDKLSNSYPFVVFNLIRQARLVNQVSMAPILTQNFLKKASDLSRMDWSNQTLENLILSVENLPQSMNGSDKSHLLNTQIDILSNINANDFWKGIVGFEDERNQALYVSALQAILNMILTKRLSKAVTAIKIPISDTSLQLPFVVFLVQILGQCLGDQPEQNKFFWYHGNDYYEASLIFFFRPLSVSGVMPIIDSTTTNEAVLDMKTTIQSLSDPTRQSVQLVRNSNGNLMEALFLWTQLLCPEL